MKNNQIYYKNRHSVFFLQYHLVVVTKYRHPVITGDLKNRLFEISRSIIDSDWKCNILEMNSDQDHIHILFEAPPHVQLSKLINNYKTVTSRLIRKEFQEFLKPYYLKPYFWSDSYFICTVSDRTEEMISHYIQNQ
jgi:putative transposase